MKNRTKSGKIVARLRNVIGKSQSQFAAMIGVSKHTIISVENGRNKLSKNLARRIQIATGAKIFEDQFRFEPVFDVPATEAPGKISPEVVQYLHGRVGRYDDTYTRKDFEQWRDNFYPSNDDAARKSFDKIKAWVGYVFQAAAKSGGAGNRDRLPAVYQSLVEWLDATRENFKLEKEIDDTLEQEARQIGERAYEISSLKKRDKMERFKNDCAAYGHDFPALKKQFKKAKPNDWIVLETESRALWDPFDRSEHVPCKARKLLQNPKSYIIDGWDFLQKYGFSKQDNLHQLKDAKAKKE